MPERVLLATEFFHPKRGGIETHVLALATNLRAAGVEAEVVTSFPGPPQVEGVPVHRIAAPRLPGLDVIFTTDGLRPFTDLLKRRAFDVVHCHLSVYGPGTIGAAWVSQHYGLPTVVTFHSVLQGYLPALRILDRLTGWSRLPVTLTAVSPVVAEGLQSILGQRPVAILPSAVDPERWRLPEPKGPSSDDVFRVVSAMRLTARKRPLALVDILARVRDLLPGDRRMSAEILGDGPRRGQVQRRIRRAGLGDLVHLRGLGTQEDVREAYARADAFVLASVEESFGLAVLEARAAGLPVVVRSDSGASSFIQDGVEGLLGDSDEVVAQALVRLAMDPGLRQGISRHNRSVAPEPSWPGLIRRHLDVYRRTMGEARASASRP